MSEGWLKIYREFLDWELYHDINCRSTFLHLLLTCTYKDIKHKGGILRAGQRAIQLRSLAAEIGISLQNLRTSLHKLKNHRCITVLSTQKETIITVVNWEHYQACSELPTHQKKNQHTTNTNSNTATNTTINTQANTIMIDEIPLKSADVKENDKLSQHNHQHRHRHYKQHNEELQTNTPIEQEEQEYTIAAVINSGDNRMGAAAEFKILVDNLAQSILTVFGSIQLDDYPRRWLELGLTRDEVMKIINEWKDRNPSKTIHGAGYFDAKMREFSKNAVGSHPDRTTGLTKRRLDSYISEEAKEANELFHEICQSTEMLRGEGYSRDAIAVAEFDPETGKLDFVTDFGYLYDRLSAMSFKLDRVLSAMNRVSQSAKFSGWNIRYLPETGRKKVESDPESHLEKTLVEGQSTFLH